MTSWSYKAEAALRQAQEGQGNRDRTVVGQALDGIAVRSPEAVVRRIGVCVEQRGQMDRVLGADEPRDGPQGIGGRGRQAGSSSSVHLPGDSPAFRVFLEHSMDAQR